MAALGGALALALNAAPALSDAAREQVEPDKVEAWLDRLGEAESESDSRRLERRILEAWHRSGSATVDLLLERATTAIEAEDHALALEYLDTIVELSPEFAEAWNKRATVYFLIREYDRAISDIGRALALQPRHFGALTGLGTILNELDEKERALAVLRRAHEIHPNFERIERTIERLTLEVEGRDI